MNDPITLVGTPTFILSDENGKEKLRFTQPNLVVALGKEFVASRMIGTGATVMSHMALGTNTTGAISTNTALGNEVGRVTFTNATVAGNVVTYTASFGPGVATGAITEAGIFNASSAGTMLARTVFSVVNKASTDTLTIQWAITVQ